MKELEPITYEEYKTKVYFATNVEEFFTEQHLNIQETLRIRDPQQWYKTFFSLARINQRH